MEGICWRSHNESRDSFDKGSLFRWYQKESQGGIQNLEPYLTVVQQGAVELKELREESRLKCFADTTVCKGYAWMTA